MRAAPSGVTAGEIPFGVLGRPHGISGELILRPYNPGGLGIDSVPLPLVVTLGHSGDFMSLAIVSARRFADGFFVKFQGVASREDAVSLTGRELRIPREALPPLGNTEFYVEDLVGCVVQDVQGKILGTVSGIFWNGAQDIMSLNGDERLIPVVPHFIVSVDPSKKIATVNLHEYE
jgi:16S rRNA processing protein RimM